MLQFETDTHVFRMLVVSLNERVKGGTLVSSSCGKYVVDRLLQRVIREFSTVNGRVNGYFFTVC